MNLQKEVLRVLEEERGRHFSGAALAKACGVSRNAVWKAIEQLRKEGYEIEAVPRKGYRLCADTDRLTAESVQALYRGERPVRWESYEEVGSTNDLARERALAGAPAWSIVLAERQHSGRGRLGRSFFSPDGGVYFSILLRPQCQAREAALLTIAAATAVAEGIEELTDKQAQIKWVNDVFVGQRKVAGILTEAAVSLEADRLDYVIVGIGINAVQEQDAFPPELQEIAGAVLSPAEAWPRWRSALVARIVEIFGDYAEHLAERCYLDSYRAHSLLIGRRVRLLQGHSQEVVTVRSINQDGNLVVEDEKGLEKTIISGEVSLRLEADQDDE